jgi:hypothetical protein
MVFKQLNETLADHSGRAQDSNWMFCLHDRRHSSVQEDGCGWCEMHSGGQGKRILISEQMQQVVIVPPGFESFSVDTAF